MYREVTFKIQKRYGKTFNRYPRMQTSYLSLQSTIICSGFGSQDDAAAKCCNRQKLIDHDADLLQNIQQDIGRSPYSATKLLYFCKKYVNI